MARNLLESALPPILSVLPLSEVKIVTKTKTIVSGFPKVEKRELNTFALVQPISNVKAQTDTAIINTEKAYNFYFTKDVAEVLEFLENIECEITYKGIIFSVYSNYDWSDNGWVKVLATQKSKSEVQNV